MHGVYLQRAHGLYLSTSIVGVVAQENPGKQLWSTPRVRLAGLPDRAPWPSPQQLISLLRTAPGRAVATQVGSVFRCASLELVCPHLACHH